ncbi:hypothetical protein C7374_101348 [Falsochrobactrum ovis]|uniref:Uncharacterized protein n=1 Tax=Falsochrobactrum ovis TaxID=1293442 RepID=A0A364JZE0_9HYPH|nr:hypothetical protein C7374_101348 [Falsochrobactrum ovis]
MKKIIFAAMLLAVGTNYASACLFSSDLACVPRCTHGDSDLSLNITCALVSPAPAPDNNLSR